MNSTVGYYICSKRNLNLSPLQIRFHHAAVVLLVFSVILGACRSTKRLGKNETLLKKVYIVCENPDIDKSEMYGYVKQKPNRKLLGLHWPKKGYLKNGSGFPLYLHIHNLVNPKREAKRQERKKRLEAAGKAKRAKRKTIGQVLTNIGEPPVVLDSTKTQRTTFQLEQYLNNKGYFRSDVTDTLIYPLFHKRRHRKAKVVYRVKPAKPYMIRNVQYTINDTNIAAMIFQDTEQSLIRSGKRYDVDVFEAERQRITTRLRNEGYFKFSRDYIRFSVDSSLNSHQLDVEIIVGRPVYRINDKEVLEYNHPRYSIRNVNVVTIYDGRLLKKDSIPVYDTINYGDVFFLRDLKWEPEYPYKPEMLFSRISFAGGMLYRDIDQDSTYRMLSNLKLFRQVLIDAHDAPNNQLDIEIKLLPYSRQSFSVQMEGTNTGSNLGIGGAYQFLNRNVNKGGEFFEVRLKGGTEAQQPLTQVDQTVGDQITFNTIEAGAEVNFNVPRALWPFNLLRLRGTENARTVFGASANYQRRIDYDRGLGNLSSGFTYGRRTRKSGYNQVGIYPLQINVVKVTPKAGLEQLLLNQDPLLQYRFTDHLIQNSRFTFIRNSKSGKRKEHFDYFQFTFEASGTALRKVFEWAGAQEDDLGSYRIAGIPFSQYVRVTTDYRHVWNFSEYQSLVIRINHGVGMPLTNFPTMPLEKSFFGGGANGIRAWEARSLGPGSYSNPDGLNYAQFGDVQAEYNIELRFKITKTLNGAIFADGGNIWLFKADSTKPLGHFDFKRFLDDYAFGPGVGLRYDLSFFILRFDWAFQIRDPAQPFGQRWYVPGRRPLASNLNFGIGYPF
jgi:outer membrane protein assembly factor BamA